MYFRMMLRPSWHTRYEHSPRRVLNSNAFRPVFTIFSLRAVFDVMHSLLITGFTHSSTYASVRKLVRTRWFAERE